MAVSTRLRWGFTGLLMVLAVVLACSDNGGGGQTDSPDAAPPVDECALSCEAPSECCGTGESRFCIDVSRDKLNCGECGNRCSPDVADSCGGSECKCGQNPACTDGKTCINPLVGCRDMQTDRQNCGARGNQCAPEETCTGGVCSCGGETCGPGTTCCSGVCTDTKTDSQNCGACHQACEGEEDACTNGSCGCPGGGTCPEPAFNILGKCCGTGACSNVCTDVTNCGECGHACPAGQTCNLGKCSDEPNPNPEKNPCIFFD
jgi:hypothetical protein